MSHPDLSWIAYPSRTNTLENWSGRYKDVSDLHPTDYAFLSSIGVDGSEDDPPYVGICVREILKGLTSINPWPSNAWLPPEDLGKASEDLRRITNYLSHKAIEEHPEITKVRDMLRSLCERGIGLALSFWLEDVDAR